jgi:hypothetical protein
MDITHSQSSIKVFFYKFLLEGTPSSMSFFVRLAEPTFLVIQLYK